MQLYIRFTRRPGCKPEEWHWPGLPIEQERSSKEQVLSQILAAVPQVVPFDQRLKRFLALIKQDRAEFQVKGNVVSPV